jgi:hypothetical protein
VLQADTAHTERGGSSSSSCASTPLTQSRWREGELVAARRAAGGVGAEQQCGAARALHQRGALIAEPAAGVGQDGGGCGAVLVAQHALCGAAAGHLQQASSPGPTSAGYDPPCWAVERVGCWQRGQAAILQGGGITGRCVVCVSACLAACVHDAMLSALLTWCMHAGVNQYLW